MRDKVFEAWEELIYQLTISLDDSKKRGGTMGHKVGSIREQQIRLKGLYETL